MRLGIVITCYNRPNELRACLESLSAATIPKGSIILLHDDASTWSDTKAIAAQFSYPGVEIQRIYSLTNGKVSKALRTGFSQLFKQGVTHAINLDSDSIVRHDFIDVLMKLKKRYPQNIISGFNSINTTLQGTPRHPIIREGVGCYLKSSIGGINMLIDETIYEDKILPALNKVISSEGNWDYLACKESMKQGRPIVVSVPSVVQHQQSTSSMGHKEEPDTACDFYHLELNKVTLLGVDCIHIDKLQAAAQQCTLYIKFADVRLFTSQAITAKNVYRCRHIGSKADYSKFIVKELSDYFDTSHCLIIQHDGYVINWRAWDNKFLDYDYVGATWWFKDGMNVGNGGFSLRSKRLQRLLQTDDTIANVHPEDERICRTYRKYLESKGIKFAPAEVADRFSIEAAYSPDKKYSGQFGFHGKGVIFK